MWDKSKSIWENLFPFVVGILVSLVLFAFSCFVCSVSSAATLEDNGTYQITGRQLRVLDSNLKKLKDINELQQSRLNEQQSQITQLNEKLARAEKSLEESNEALTTADGALTKAQDSLTSANKSLMKLSKEEKRTRLRIKRQRNTFIVVSSLLLISYLKK